MNRERKGILWMVGAMLCWGTSGFFLEFIPWDPMLIAAVRAVPAGVTIFVYMRLRGLEIRFDRRAWKIAMPMCAVCILYVVACKLSTAANAGALQQISPFFLLVLTAILYKTPIRRCDLLAAVFTMVGVVLFFLKKFEPNFMLGNILGLLSGIPLALMYLFMGDKVTEAVRLSATLLSDIISFFICLPFSFFTPSHITGLSVVMLVLFGVIQLGVSYSVTRDVDVFNTMTDAQGPQKFSTITYPSGVVETTADDIHSLRYVPGSREQGMLNQRYYVDDYTGVSTAKSGMSQMGYSFSIGIISVILAYLLAVPLGVLMALNKDKLIDKLGTFYIIFIMAVPSLGYIFIFRAIGSSFKLPTTFDVQNPTVLMYILPVISLALPSIANLMKWLRRYMIDQMNSDYVKFARSGGLSEGEIFRKHILKNAIIPVVHGIPGSVLGALTGAIITERVYLVPGIGNVLTTAINKYDNGVIVGVALFYALLSVTSFILGDVLMSMLDPRISFSSKSR